MLKLLVVKYHDHLKAAPKLTSKVLHPGSCKQSVPEALAIFHPPTSAGIKNYFPDLDDAAEFLNLINTWWIVLNAKDQCNFSHSLGNAEVINDQKPEFLRAMSNWVEKWEKEKIPNCEKFCLSTPTSSALRRTLLCHAALIEDLLKIDCYKFILTARFQSDPIEWRFG